MKEQENMCIRKHETGFCHFDFDLDGIEQGFDFGIKFDPDPRLGDETYTGEPYLSLYVSVYHPKYQRQIKKRLEYSLYRSKWKNFSKCTDEDEVELRNRALDQIKSDVQSIINGKEPEAFNSPQFL